MGPDRAGSVIRLVLWRHGQTTWNAERRFQGQTDIPLDDTGLAQADRAARLLASLRPTAIFTSDMSRAAQTAQRLGAITGLAAQLDKDLRERNGGSWEGMTDAEIRLAYPAEYAQWNPPDGETVEVVAERAAAAFSRIAEGLPAGGLAVIVSHGGAISMGISRLLGLPERNRVIGPLANCAWSVLGRRAGHWRLLEHNVGRLPEPVSAAEPGGAH
ncbi:MAG TPA: histidine phosphatase family protein [Streptosporangiaceae bacterium]|jgi:probable phosphoglycerate mutase